MDSVELEQLALLFSRLDTDHDGVLMFGEFLPAHLPPILLPSSSHPPPILLPSSSHPPLILLRLFPVSRRVLPVHPAGEPLAARALHGERAASHVPQVRSQRRATSLYLLLLSLLLSLLTTHYSLLTTLYSLLTTTSAGDDLIDLNEFVHMQWQAGRLDVQSQRSQVTQSINQPVDQSVNQPVSKPVNQ